MACLRRTIIAIFSAVREETDLCDWSRHQLFFIFCSWGTLTVEGKEQHLWNQTDWGSALLAGWFWAKCTLCYNFTICKMGIMISSHKISHHLVEDKIVLKWKHINFNYSYFKGKSQMLGLEGYYSNFILWIGNSLIMWLSLDRNDLLHQYYIKIFSVAHVWFFDTEGSH